MQLIGTLDSPYVRRVAVSLNLLGLPYEHKSVSVFSAFDEFRAINPVVKAPSLVCDNGTVLMDSTLILDYAEALAAGSGRTLMPTALPERAQALRLIGLALAACEKTVQIVYERKLRPAEKIHEPWIDRVTSQLLAAYGELETALGQTPLAATEESIDQAGLTVAVAWRFTLHMLPNSVIPDNFPALREFSRQAETLPAFQAANFS
ncbi:glutathione S-transferase [Pseudomonas duriflava]|uniref:Glutathione S-transferase n=1 Tax=Pseudomonas duriflava TaxID=459528 RepID=A0A562QL81_9PSED|nr:glutathione S-transferase [Pseudomonas duriflava]TWI57474.1 glutathione S-transferase [Pseudomonas duriflava]